MFFFLSGTDGLSAYDQAGQELNTFGLCHKYAISYDGSIVAVVNKNKLTVYEHNIPLMEFAVPSMHVRSMVISDNGSVLAFIDSQNLYIYDLTEGSEKFRSSIKKPKVLAMSSDGGLIVVAGEERHTTSHITVQLFNQENDVVWKWSRVLEHEYETVHRIDFTDDKYLHIYTTDDLFNFMVE